MNYDECDKLSHSSKNINDVIDGLQEKVECELKENIKRECNWNCRK